MSSSFNQLGKDSLNTPLAPNKVFFFPVIINIHLKLFKTLPLTKFLTASLKNKIKEEALDLNLLKEKKKNKLPL